ncbi:hypothetical protein K1T71_004157 [Dendrolimus kikuchii]|uniref:Uncharacterized protein n=1 Tax=Dendrolimus kikuchii TaxID=765133 RepID=A0ACC1D9Z9_9NEOP|nr:hypothetical protein K1T71_004157 [Dendrolimus kikuchii]
MSRLILHRAFGSPPARSVMMLSDILGLQMEYKDVNILLGEQKLPEFKKLNPMRTVPVLEDDGFILSESHAILKYLTAKYGDKEQQERWYPSSLRTRSIVDQTMFFNAGVFFIAFRDAAFATMFGGATEPTPQNIKSIESSYEIAEAYLLKRKYMAADHMTLADLCTGTTATVAQIIHKVNSDRYPRYADWLTKMQEEPVFQKVNSPGVVFMEKLFNKMWKENRSRQTK